MKRKEILEVLVNLRLENKLVAIYADRRNTDEFFVGRIIDYDEDGLFFHVVEENGCDSSVILFSLNDIYMIKSNSEYINTIESKVVDTNGVDGDEALSTYKMIRSYNLLYDVLYLCQAKSMIAKVQLYFGDIIVGAVDKIGGELLTFNQMTADNRADGKVFVRIEDIQRVYIEDKDMKRIKILVDK